MRCCCAGKTTTIRALADLLPQVPVVAKDPFNSGGWLQDAAADMDGNYGLAAWNSMLREGGWGLGAGGVG